MNTIYHMEMGIVSYEDAWSLQKKIHEIVLKKNLMGVLLTLQHNDVVTLGKNAKEEYLTRSPEELFKDGVQIVRSDRGGEVTAHNLGQFVAYPILNLSTLKLMPKKYIFNLEQSIINTLARFQLIGTRDQINPGIWLQLNKVCAVGIRLSKRVSLHGIALNVNNDLGIFDNMIPCGIRNRGVTSLEKTLEKPVSLPLVRECFINEFSKVFAINKILAPDKHFL